MYLRTIQRRNKDGTVARYVQLAHNERHPVSGNSVARVLHSFGREETLDRDVLRRIVASINRYLGEMSTAPQIEADDEEVAPFEFCASRRLGGVWALDGLWCRLGIDRTLRKLIAGRQLDARVERVLFALVANRALEPVSKLAAARWVAERAAVPGLDEVTDNACYRAMDWLLEVHEELATAVYFATADLAEPRGRPALLRLAG